MSDSDTIGMIRERLAVLELKLEQLATGHTQQIGVLSRQINELKKRPTATAPTMLPPLTGPQLGDPVSETGVTDLPKAAPVGMTPLPADAPHGATD